MTEGRRFARQYVHTAGRTRAAGEHYPLEALVQCTPDGMVEGSRQQPTHRRVLQMTAEPTSIAELGAHLGVHAGIIRVVVSDLAAAGLVVVEQRRADQGAPDLTTLNALLGELERLE